MIGNDNARAADVCLENAASLAEQPHDVKDYFPTYSTLFGSVPAMRAPLGPVLKPAQQKGKSDDTGGDNRRPRHRENLKTGHSRNLAR